MNTLGLVFGLLMIFTCMFSLSLRKEMLAQTIEKTHLAHQTTTRKILDSYQSECYKKLPPAPKVESGKDSSDLPSEEDLEPSPLPEQEINHFNGICARLNLWPLVQEGREKYPDLYETAAKILSHLYGPFLFPEEKRLEYTLLDTLLTAAKDSLGPSDKSLPLEKISLKRGGVKRLYPLHEIYYRMLKGTKKVATLKSYPSLIELFVLERQASDTKICLRHASYELFTALFGSRVAPRLYQEVHQSKTALAKDTILDICKEGGNIGVREEMLDLFDSTKHHLSGERVLVEEDSGISLKRRVMI
jgi:hypothetical protein